MDELLGRRLVLEGLNPDDVIVMVSIVTKLESLSGINVGLKPSVVEMPYERGSILRVDRLLTC